MRLLRNIYFWMALGSVAVVVGGDIYSMKFLDHPDSKESQEAEDERSTEGKSTANLDPYEAGFLTAVVLGGAWFGIYKLNNPKQ